MKNTIRRRPFAFLATAFLAGLPILPATAADLILGETASNETVTYNRDPRAFDDVYIGIDPSYTNNKLILTGTSGQFATVNVTTRLDSYVVVGARGNGNQMEISQGAKLNSNYGFIGGGFYSGSSSASNNNTVLVTGSNSTWTMEGSLRIGGARSVDSTDPNSSGSGNSLIISNGGRVISNHLYTNVNDDAGVSSNNTITVNGTNSLLKVNQSFYIGDTWDGGSLTISNGGRVESTQTRFGDSGGNLTATVTGANSTWAISSGYLTIGGGSSSDNNIVRVLNGGNITLSNPIQY